MKAPLFVLNCLLLIYAVLISFGFMADTSPIEQNIALTFACMIGAGGVANLWTAIHYMYFLNNKKLNYVVISINCIIMICLPILSLIFKKYGLGILEILMIETILILDCCFVASGKSQDCV